ncbi:hypothetical protein [Mycobacteroides abscessus]|uniref:hypothetical protein n=1 Tax=Mycobacteroides abscessus TaxID=36809 RepID=UPI0009A1B44B|nr:hypothetical protein [Mycobacteroides abscessus]
MDSDVTDIRWMWTGCDSFSNPQAIVGLVNSSPQSCAQPAAVVDVTCEPHEVTKNSSRKNLEKLLK